MCDVAIYLIFITLYKTGVHNIIKNMIIIIN